MDLTFGERIREARKAKGFTQKQLADKIGAKHNSISDWENNKNKPDPDTIEILCGVLSITPNYLLKATAEDFSIAEKNIIHKYRKLDPQGQEHVDTVLEWESNRTSTIADQAARIAELEQSKITQLPDRSYLEPVAAHERADQKMTDKMAQEDYKIMASDDEWK